MTPSDPVQVVTKALRSGSWGGPTGVGAHRDRALPPGVWHASCHACEQINERVAAEVAVAALREAGLL